MENVESRSPPKTETPIGHYTNRIGVKFIILNAITWCVGAYGMISFVETAKPAIGTQPKKTVFILKDSIDRIIGQAMCRTICSKYICRNIKMVQSASRCANPYFVIVGKTNRADII